MMWVLIAVLLVPLQGKPDSTVLKAFDTKAECEQFKSPLIKKLIETYDFQYPFNFKLECRLVEVDTR